MGRTRIAVEVRDSLQEAEVALLDAIAKYEALQNKIVSARRDLGLTGTVGDAAIARAAEVGAALNTAWSIAEDTHAELDVLKQSLGFRHVAAFPKQARVSEEVRAA